MCFRIIEAMYRWRRADENITVWKIAYPTYAPTPTVLSAIYDFPYRLGEKYAMPLEYITDYMIKETNLITICNLYKGFHSYETKVDALHAVNKCAWERKVSIVECIIPKDAMYMADGYGCVISNEIILKEITHMVNVGKIKCI